MIVVLFWVGCEDLDFSDPNRATTDVATIQTLVTGAEAGMRVDLGIYLRDLLVVGREAYYLEPADPRYTGEIMRGPVDGGGFLATRPWNANYKIIQNCLNLAESGDGGASGVGKTIHAYALMRVLSLTDENGARTNYDGDITVTPATKAEVFDEIESLLDGGYTDLNAAGASFSFSLSTGFDGFDTPSTFAEFNRALRARVAVHQSDYATALTALGLSFLDAAGDLDLGVFHVFSSSANDLDNQMYEAADADVIKLTVHPSVLDSAEAGDLRFSTNVTTRDDTIRYDDLQSFLAPTVWTSSYDAIPIIRNEELILLQAEAYIGTGDYSSAETNMNIVRDAAGLADYSGTGATNAVDRVLYEKQFSLFFEGHRLQDMRHYGRTGELPIDRDGDAIVTFPIPEYEVPG